MEAMPCHVLGCRVSRRKVPNCQMRVHGSDVVRWKSRVVSVSSQFPWLLSLVDALSVVDMSLLVSVHLRDAGEAPFDSVGS